MSLSPREKLRHDVRAIVHRACWRRFEGDEAGADALVDGELSRMLIAAGDTAPDDTVVRAWLEEDRGDFDRGIIIGELVARRVASATSPVTTVTATVPMRGAPATVTRVQRVDAPAIADLLDDMLEQDRRTHARA